MYDEGYIKYQCHWEKGVALDASLLTRINQFRSQLYERRLIGYDEQHQVGYGNISIRHPKQPNTFIISGTQTGHLPELTNAHYSWITNYDIDANTLNCTGPIKASSESLTHAAIYELDKDYQAVIHIHSLAYWEQWKGHLPTTAADVPYGTPEMAYEVRRLYEEENLKTERILVMAGHIEGVITFGNTLTDAWTVLLKHM